MRLGGRHAVLRDAPVVHASPLGEGVWLQLTETPEPNTDARNRFTSFVAPLFDWTNEEVSQLLPVLENEQSNPSLPEVRRSSSKDIASLSTLRWTDVVGDHEAAINIHTSNEMTEEQQLQIISLLKLWIANSLDENKSPLFGVNTLSSSTFVICGELELGSYDTNRIDQALEGLRVRLSELSEIQVREIVLGLETVG